MQELSKLEPDSITEIMAIGAGHASKALSQMTEKRITVKVPNVEIRPLEKIPEVLGNPEEEVVTVYVGLKSNEMDENTRVGSLIFIYPMESAIELSAMLLEKEDYKVDTGSIELDDFRFQKTEARPSRKIDEYILPPGYTNI
ncbi:MAG: chemotaxis protein CheC [Candidatus Altiarchaeota archaeon]|nr:chemotaxis protein CheC [Candidatus Altiarchaeota archaeon]